MRIKRKNRWAWGDKRRLANMVGISAQHLNGILAGIKACNPDRAIALERAANLLGYRITAIEWAFPMFRRSPLFTVDGRHIPHA